MFSFFESRKIKTKKITKKGNRVPSCSQAPVARRAMLLRALLLGVHPFYYHQGHAVPHEQETTDNVQVSLEKF